MNTGDFIRNIFENIQTVEAKIGDDVENEAIISRLKKIDDAIEALLVFVEDEA